MSKNKSKVKVDISPAQAAYDRKVADIAAALGSVEKVQTLLELFAIDSETVTSPEGLTFTRGIFEQGFMGTDLESTGAHYVARKFHLDEVRAVGSALAQALLPKSDEVASDTKKEETGQYE